MSAAEQPLLVLPDVAAWRVWLDQNEDSSDGVLLVLAKKGTTEPTSLTYAQALQEALCSGWIDGQSKRIDDATYRVRFTPRRKTSIWSKRNVGFVAELVAQGRMRERGLAEVERARADGRWDRAYDGPATMQVPEDLSAALGADPAAREAFEKLGGQGRYAVLHRVVTATPSNRANRITGVLRQLVDGTFR